MRRRLGLLLIVVGVAAVVILPLVLQRTEAPPPPADAPPTGGAVTALALVGGGPAIGNASGDVAVIGGARWFAHPEPVRALTAVDGDLLTAGGEGTVARWSLAGEQRWRRRLESERLNDGRPLGDDAVVAGVKGTVARLGAAGAVWRDPAAHRGPAFALAVSPDGRVVASGGADGRIVLRDAADGASRGEVEAHAGWVLALAWDAAGIVSGGADGAVKRWAADLAPGPVLVAAGPAVIDVAAADGRVLFATDDGAVHLDARALAPPGERHLGVALAGERAFAGGVDGAVTIWDVRTGARIDRVRSERGGPDVPDPARPHPGAGSRP